jgi:hypothetical protein
MDKVAVVTMQVITNLGKSTPMNVSERIMKKKIKR